MEKTHAHAKGASKMHHCIQEDNHEKLGEVDSRNRQLYIYIYAVKLLSGPSLATFKVINWAKSKFLSGPSLFSHYKNRGFRRFFGSIIICVFFACPVICYFSKNSLFFLEKRVQKLGFSNFSVLS